MAGYSATPRHARKPHESGPLNSVADYTQTANIGKASRRDSYPAGTTFAGAGLAGWNNRPSRRTWCTTGV